MKYDYIEIGISNTESLCQKYPDGIGITIEPLKFYFDRIKISTGHSKLNISIGNTTGIFHVYSEEDVTKAQLLHFFNKKWNLKLKVEEVVSENSVNRTLRTNKDFNGILNLPNIESMINEL